MTPVPVNHEIELSITPKDMWGNPARVDGDPVWTKNDGADLDLIPTADPFKIIARARNVTGAALVTVTVDADLGEGFRALTGVEAIAIIPGEAVTLAINAGAPTPAPAPAADPVSTDTSASEATTEVTADPVVTEVVADPVVEVQPEVPAADPVVADAAVTETQPADAATETSAEGGETPAG